jgi:hypothetical protein
VLQLQKWFIKSNDIVKVDRRVKKDFKQHQKKAHSLQTNDSVLRKLLFCGSRLLTVDQEHTRRILSQNDLNLLKCVDPINFLQKFVTVERHGSIILLQKPNSSLHCGSILVYPAKEGK